MIRLDAVSHAWGDHRVLDDISCVLEESRIGVIGPNGAGKSSLARLLNGLLLPASGHVSIDGYDTRKHTAAVRRQVGFVFQNPDVQIIYPSVEEDIGFGLDNLGVTGADRQRRIDAIIERFRMQAWRGAASHSLSGGQKQLLALASVLVMEPAILVLDEPTTLLDRANTERLRRLIAGLVQQVVLVTHDFDDIRGFDRVLVIDEGRIVGDATPEVAIDLYCRRVADTLHAESSSAGSDRVDAARHP